MSTLPTSQRIDAVIETARSQIGYRAAPLKQTPFRITAGDWGGSFVSWVLAENKCLCPNLDNTAAGLAYYTQRRRLYMKPRRGDIAFYSFTFNGEPGQPHAGLVTDTASFTRNGAFTAIEGQTASARPRESQDPTGVFERSRFRYDVIGFARPDYRPRRAFNPMLVEGAPTLRPSQIRAGGDSGAIATVQTALAMTVGLSGYTRGVWSSACRSAYAAWQRQEGWAGTGQPGANDLYALGFRTRLFNVRD